MLRNGSLKVCQRVMMRGLVRFTSMRLGPVHILKQRVTSFRPY